MLLEVAEIEVSPGREEEFAYAMENGGLAGLAACEGVISARMGRCVEHPNRFTFLVRWTSIEAHNAARDLDGFRAFSGCFADRAIGGKMSHYMMSEAVAGASA